jgi:hypothetical protein
VVIGLGLLGKSVSAIAIFVVISGAYIFLNHSSTGATAWLCGNINASAAHRRTDCNLDCADRWR